MTEFVAFLRGVNLGRRRMKMQDLRACFEALGHAPARTLRASGNVLFAARSVRGLARSLEAGLEARFGYPVGVVLRTREALRAAVAADPFGGRREDADTKLYVTFLADPVADTLADPCAVLGDFEVVARTESEVFAVGYRQPSGRFGAGMDSIGKHFEGRTLWTTRNWNTVLAAAAPGEV